MDNNIDLVCIFATWPETYSYTLTECYMASVPVLTFDIGAVGDRVKNDELGWTMEFDTNTEKIFEKIEKISEDKDEYQKIKNHFKVYKFKTIEEMQKYYTDLYGTVNGGITDEIMDIYKFNNYKLKAESLEFQQYQLTYGHVVHKYEKMRNTKLWKIAKKIKRKIKGK